MEAERQRRGKKRGRFLAQAEQRISRGRWLTVAVLLAWDGLLLYMIVGCLIEPVYGAAFVAVVSVYLGYQL